MFEKIVETLNNTGKAVGEKTKQGTELVKANLKVSNEERELEVLFGEIGKLYYSNNKQEPCCDEMKELFDKVNEKTSSLGELRTQIRSLKGIVVCQSCGIENSFENDYCGKCGAKLVKPEPVVEETKSDEIVDHEETVEVTDENGENAINIEVADNDTEE